MSNGVEDAELTCGLFPGRDSGCVAFVERLALGSRPGTGACVGLPSALLELLLAEIDAEKIFELCDA